MSTSLEPGPEWERKWAWSASSTRLAQNHGLPKVVFGNGRRMELPAVLPLTRFTVQTEGWARSAPQCCPTGPCQKTAMVKALSCLLQFTQGSDGLLHRKLQLDTVRDFGETFRDHEHRVGTKPRKQTEPSWTQISDPNRPIRMGKLESVWATLSWMGSPGNPPSKASIVLCMPVSCPVAYEAETLGGRVRWVPRIAEEFAMHTAGQALTGSPPTSDSLLPTISG